MEKGIVFAIEEFSVFDGAGIRTTVFLKGCPLHCNWCHNPEGFSFTPQIVRNLNSCIKCGRCENVIKMSPQDITEFDLNVCPKRLLRVSGTEYLAEDLASALLKNADILNMSGGGVTFSGGECLSQSAFLREVISKIHPTLNIAIETSGYAKTDDFLAVASCVDFIYFDLKLIDKEDAKTYLGVDNSVIMENFAALQSASTPFVVRMPLIPTVTDTQKNYKAIMEIVKDSRALGVELLPYNKFAGGKYSGIGKKYSPKFDEAILPIIDERIFLDNGIKVKIL